MLYLTSPRRVCASTARIGDTLTLPAVGRLRDGTELPAGTRVQVAVTEAHVSRSPADPVRLSFALRTLILPPGEQQPVTGDVLAARVERARTAGGAFDACVPQGGQVTIRLADLDR
jgi:hypothetical protein